VCHTRLHKKLVRVLLGFRLGVRVRDSVGGPVVIVRHRLFNRHLDVPWDGSNPQSTVRFHAVCVKSPRFPIVHVTVKVVTIPDCQEIFISSY
jgi:hypothetical protein